MQNLLEELVGRTNALLDRAAGENRRVVVGLVGAPGAGKSTLAQALAGSIATAAYVPMDGFHLADVELDRQGLRDRKGAPETFDAYGYAALLARLRAATPETVYAPGFERDLEQPLAGAIAVPPESRLVVTEGNYLLLDRPEWRAVRDQIDEVWYVDGGDDVRMERLVARHVAFGKTPEEAAAWVERVDVANGRLIEASRDRADLHVDVSAWSPPT